MSTISADVPLRITIILSLHTFPSCFMPHDARCARSILANRQNINFNAN